MQSEIRRATSSDLTSIADLTIQLGYPTPLVKLAENLDHYLNAPDHIFLVAVQNDTVVGYIAMFLVRTFHREGKQMRIVSLVVNHAHRGKGVGKKLLKAAEVIAQEQNCWVIEVTSSARRKPHGTHDFYLSQEYVNDGSQAYFRKLICP